MSSLPDDTQTQSIAHYLAVVRRRFWLIFLIAALTVGAAAAYTFTRQPVYRATMKIVVGQGESLFAPGVGSAADQFTQTMSDLLRSDVVATGVIDELNLTTSPTKLLANLDVSTKPQTAVLEVSYDDTNRRRGLLILREVGNTFTDLVRAKLASNAPAQDPATADGEAAVTATVFDEAHSLPDPVWPRPILSLAVALLLGIAVGVIAAFVKDQLDDRIRDVSEAEKAFGQSAVATMPRKFLGYQPLVPAGKSRRLWRRRMNPFLAELAVQKLRAGVIWSWDSGRQGTLLVTSAHPEEGKTTIAANLAVSMAREGHEVIIVDADLRRPQLYKYLKVDVGPSTRGLDSVVRGEVPLRAALIDIPLDGGSSSRGADDAGSVAARLLAHGDGEVPQGGRLQALLSAPGRTRPSEFSIARIGETIDELRQLADYVIFDAPPLLLVTDAFPLVVAADTVIAVVRNEKSTAAATLEMSRTLARLRIRGVRRGELVVTDVQTDFDAGRYGYYSVETVSSGPAR